MCSYYSITLAITPAFNFIDNFFISLSTFTIVESKCLFFFHTNMWFAIRQLRILPESSICHLYLKYYLHGPAEKLDTQSKASLDTQTDKQ